MSNGCFILVATLAGWLILAAGWWLISTVIP